MKMFISYVLKATLLSMAGLLLVSSAYAQEAQEKKYITPSEYPENVYFGDAHVHTATNPAPRLDGDRRP